MLSPGARRLFRIIHRFINRYGKFFAGQAWLSNHFKVCVRTVGRWMRELISERYIDRTVRPNRSHSYRILKELSEPMSEPMSEPLKEEPSVVIPENKLARKPMQVEIPQEYVTVGERQYLNPAWTRVRDAIREAHQSGRVQNARNREAYIAAIIRSETRAS